MKIHPFYIAPVLPRELIHLRDIAMNLWFSWNWEAVELFIRIDEVLWEEVYQNPIAMLGRVSQARLKELAQDNGFVSNVERVYNKLHTYLQEEKWYQELNLPQDMQIAYFSMEFGLAEALPVYSGGLGVLAGDHLKSASDMGIPLIGIGLLYRQGYFRQRLNADGWQMEEYPENDWYNMSVTLEMQENGEPHLITVIMGDQTVYAHIWRVQVGSVQLLLLDTNFPQNSPWARQITTQLYGGDRDMRLRQEFLLGVGGARALKTLGMNPTVYHMNEGHSAFMILERIRDLMLSESLTFQEAREFVRSTNIFTTHTPVPAGNEQFDTELLRRYLEPWIGRIGVTFDEFIRMGRVKPECADESFGMTVFALRNAAYNNGVSRLHGEVSRRMWKDIWSNALVPEIPIQHITNGIHPRSWMCHELVSLLHKYAGIQFGTPRKQELWDAVEQIPDVELWRIHELRRRRLVEFARKRLRHQLRRRHAQPLEIAHAEEILDPHALTIGFARRMATYKRANLLFSDLERLKKILSNTDRPIQFIIAGKAHPHDMPAKVMIKDLIHIIHEDPFRSHFVFLEDYDINVARYLVQGVDVWLNTPRRPLEASGTSGMKAAMNGVLNVSVLDGWWDEGFDADVGWSLGGSEDEDPAYQDKVESEALYNCLENNVLPLFYNRDASGIPWEWLKKMKQAMRKLGREFNTHRMLSEYTRSLYLPAHQAYQTLYPNHYERSKLLNQWENRIRQVWNQVSIEHVEVSADYKDLKVGDALSIAITVRMPELTPDDVSVEVLFGALDSRGELEGTTFRAVHVKKEKEATHTFQLDIPCAESGQHGFSVRIRPEHPNLAQTFSYEFIKWG